MGLERVTSRLNANRSLVKRSAALRRGLPARDAASKYEPTLIEIAQLHIIPFIPALFNIYQYFALNGPKLSTIQCYSV